MGITPDIHAQARALIRLGLVTVGLAGRVWRRHQSPPDGQVEPPGSLGEHELQRRYGSQDRARRFYHRQMLDGPIDPATIPESLDNAGVDLAPLAGPAAVPLLGRPRGRPGGVPVRQRRPGREASGGRRLPLADVPLQDLALAVQETRRVAGDLHFRGIAVGSNAARTNLGDESLPPFWEAVRERDLFGSCTGCHRWARSAWGCISSRGSSACPCLLGRWALFGRAGRGWAGPAGQRPPFDIGEPDPVGQVKAAVEDEATRAAILGETAAKLLNVTG